MRNFLLAFFILVGTLSQAQIVSLSGGDWNNPAIWNCNCIPNSSNGTIAVNHAINIPSGFSVTIDQTTISASASLNVQNGGTLTIANVTDGLVVNGTLIGQQGSSVNGTTGTNIRFNSGSNYNHQFTTAEGTIPRANWNANSTLNILGYTTFSSAASATWTQSFGNVIWACASQATTITLNGLLRTALGNFTVSNTNGQVFQFSTTNRNTITISGNVVVSGNSRINVNSGANAAGVVLNIGGDFNIIPAGATTSFLTTTGNTTVNVTGNFLMNSAASTFFLANTNNNTAVGTLNITGNFTLTAGTITEGANDGAGAEGRIYFAQGGGVHTFTNTGTISNRIAYQLSSNTDVLRLVGESQLIGNGSSSFTLNGGTLIVESTHASGAIQTGSGVGAGNIRTVTRTFNSGSRVSYSGAGQQVVGNGHVSTVALILNSSVGVQINVPGATAVCTGLTLSQGVNTLSNTNLTINGPFTVDGGTCTITAASAARAITSSSFALNGGALNIAGTGQTMAFTVNGDLAFTGGTLNLSNTANVASFSTFGNFTSSGGHVNISSGTANYTVTTRGNFSGTDLFTFAGNNSNLNILGSGPVARSFPFISNALLENLTINHPTGSIAIDVPLTVTNNLTVLAGDADLNQTTIIQGDLEAASSTTVFFEGSELQLRSQFNSIQTGGLLSSNNASRLRLTTADDLGTLAFSPSGNTLGILTLNRPTAGTLLRLNSPLTITDSLVLRDGQFDHTSGLTMGTNSVVARHPAATMIGAIPAGVGYNVTYFGGSLFSGVESAGSLNNLNINSSGTVTLLNAISATGQLTILNTGALTAGGNSISAGTLVNGGAFSAPSSSLTLSGNWTNNGTFSHNSGTIAFSGTTTISGSVNPTVFNIIISGVLNPPALFVIAGQVQNNGTFNTGNGTVRFSGSASQAISGSTVLNSFFNVDVTNAALPTSLTFNTNTDLRGRLTLSNASVVDVNGSGNNRTFTLRSTNDTPVADGSIGPILGTAAIQGGLTMERYMRAEVNVNRYLSSPFTNALMSSLQDDMTASSNSVKWFWENQPNKTYAKRWQEITSPSTILTPGRGYAVWMYQNLVRIWDATGTINSGPLNLPVTRVNSTPAVSNADGWNLVGNPYPSSISWSNTTAWVPVNIATTIYVPDENPGGWRMYNSFDNSGDLPNGDIAMGQAFWVYADNSPSLQITESAKIAPRGGNFYRTKTSDAPSNQLVVVLHNQSYTDKAFLKTNADATVGFDWNFDAYKLKNDHLNVSLIDDELSELGMHTLPLIKEEAMIPVTLEATTAGDYFLSIETENFPDASQMSLFDQELGEILPLQTVKNYPVKFSRNTRNISGRFFIVKGDIDREHSISVFPNPASDALYISLPGDRTCDVVLLDNYGKAHRSVNGKYSVYLDIQNLPVGLYFVRISSGSDVIVKKIVKK